MLPARLKTLWEHAENFREREERWNRVCEAGIPYDDPRSDAAERVIEMCFDDEEVSIIYNHAGAIRISDPAGLAARLSLDSDQLAGHPLAFTEDDELIAPWEITELIVTTAARQNPTPILEYVASGRADGSTRGNPRQVVSRWSAQQRLLLRA